MNNTFRISSVVLPFVCCCSHVMAHPGHGHPEQQFGWMHYLTAPAHAIPGALALLAIPALYGLRKWQQRRHSASLPNASHK